MHASTQLPLRSLICLPTVSRCATGVRGLQVRLAVNHLMLHLPVRHRHLERHSRIHVPVVRCIMHLRRNRHRLQHAHRRASLHHVMIHRWCCMLNSLLRLLLTAILLCRHVRHHRPCMCLTVEMLQIHRAVELSATFRPRICTLCHLHTGRLGLLCWVCVSRDNRHAGRLNSCSGAATRHSFGTL